ncbi:MAG: nitroreductase [Candidatus Diapherotrites archaeon]|uniref:Nitroreductase n=1 Tax=Candidatus Iainarchaeum sp. TaxID=3101447 RepID=A0A8T5GFL3_9ARCH|nr:nitroreductase [Candidatus Diapherotrites archaeon]
MNFFDVIQKRYSVRDYKDKEVKQELIDKILTAADLAPTASNAQPFKIFIAKTKGNEEALQKVYGRAWFTKAPFILCVCGIPEKAWKRQDGKNYCEVDSTIVADHIILAATALGLGTCWIANFNEDEIRKFFNIPRYMVPEIITPLGYANDSPKEKVRKDINDLVEFKE